MSVRGSKKNLNLFKDKKMRNITLKSEKSLLRARKVSPNNDFINCLWNVLRVALRQKGVASVAELKQSGGEIPNTGKFDVTSIFPFCGTDMLRLSQRFSGMAGIMHEQGRASFWVRDFNRLVQAVVAS